MALEEIVFDCARTKIGVVAEDERDSGRRAVLNLGHTVGHAIEAASGYSSATATARRWGSGCSPRSSSRGRASCATEVADLLGRHGLPMSLDAGIDIDAIVAAVARDKKATAEGVGFVLAERPGEVRVGESVDPRRPARGGRRTAGESRRMKGSHNRVGVLHGVNLDTLGRRDPEIYGTFTLAELETQVKRWARELDLEATFFQTNHEGEFCEYLHRAPERIDGVIVNAGAWTHYSWAIRDALEVAGVPAVEVHISDVCEREDWR